MAKNCNKEQKQQKIATVHVVHIRVQMDDIYLRAVLNSYDFSQYSSRILHE